MGGPVCGPPPGGPPGVTGTHGRTDPTIAGFKASFRERKHPSVHPSIRPSVHPPAQGYDRLSAPPNPGVRPVALAPAPQRQPTTGPGHEMSRCSCDLGFQGQIQKLLVFGVSGKVPRASDDNSETHQMRCMETVGGGGWSRRRLFQAEGRGCAKVLRSREEPRKKERSWPGVRSGRAAGDPLHSSLAVLRRVWAFPRLDFGIRSCVTK